MTPRSQPALWNSLRIAMAIAILAAILAQLDRSVDTASALHRDVGTTAVNFFSFFTILSNLSGAVVLAWAGIWWWRNRDRDDARTPRAMAVALACVSTYMIVTGLVYNVLLRTVELPQGSEPVWWSNEILHLVGPVFFAIDLFLSPSHRRLRWSTVATVLVFPIVWIVYTLVRGPKTTNPITGQPWWYPYPFLDPNTTGGYAGISAYVVAIAILISLVAAGVVWIGRRRAGTVDAR